jgi:hypothetical protein
VSKTTWLLVGLWLAGLFALSALKLEDFYTYRITHPDADGYINNPIYGRYPAEVPFHQGMDILPGQSAVVIIPLRIAPPDTRPTAAMTPAI